MPRGLCSVLLLIAVGILNVHARLCTLPNIEKVARVVFGESRGEILRGQVAVAYTILNRINHAGYPNTLTEVVFQKTFDKKAHQYETLDIPGHSKAWESSKQMKDKQYFNAVRSAATALCFGKNDPTGCATDFCAVDPCAATSSNQYWTVYNKTKIGGHWFVCRRKA